MLYALVFSYTFQDYKIYNAQIHKLEFKVDKYLYIITFYHSGLINWINLHLKQEFINSLIIEV